MFVKVCSSMFIDVHSCGTVAHCGFAIAPLRCVRIGSSGERLGHVAVDSTECSSCMVNMVVPSCKSCESVCRVQMFGETAPPIEWDKAGEYSRESISVFYLSHAGTPLKEEQIVDMLKGEYPTGYVENGVQVRIYTGHPILH
jgi:hypothetical protein